MTQAARAKLPPGAFGVGALLIGGIVAALIMPKAGSVARKAVRRATGTTYRDQKAGGPQPSVDPAQARAA